MNAHNFVVLHPARLLTKQSLAGCAVWLVTQHEAIGQAGYRYQVAWPIWYVVKALPDPRYHEDRWKVIRRDICPACGGHRPAPSPEDVGV